MAFTAILDANVLYPAAQRDLLIRLAQIRLYRGRWTRGIIDEMSRAIIRNRPDLAGRLERTCELMCQAVPDCLVTGHETMVDALTLPDPDDRHVLAAAIRCGAQVIVTHNLKDFPADTLGGFGIEAQSPDEFLFNLVDLRPAIVTTVLHQQVAALKNPPQSLDDLLDTLDHSGLHRTTTELRRQLTV